MSKVDLDQWEKAADWVRNIDPSTGLRIVTADPEEVDAVVAELRAAREVIKAADSYRAFLPLEVVQRLEDYDAILEEPSQ